VLGRLDNADGYRAVLSCTKLAALAIFCSDDDKPSRWGAGVANVDDFAVARDFLPMLGISYLFRRESGFDCGRGLHRYTPKAAPRVARGDLY